MSIERIEAGVAAPAPPADLRTVRAAASGDLVAFEALAEASLGPSFRLAAAILGDAAEAGQATQHALVATWLALPRLDPPDGFDAWLRRLLVDECRMRLRQREPSSTSAPAADPAAILDTLETSFERLDPDDRAIVVLHQLEGRPVAEIATLLHLSASTVELRLREARATLLRSLETV